MASGSDDAEMAGSGELATGTLAVVLARQGRPQEAQEMVDKVGAVAVSTQVWVMKVGGGGAPGSSAGGAGDGVDKVWLLGPHQMCSACVCLCAVCSHK